VEPEIWPRGGLTTFLSYGTVTTSRQGEIIRGFAKVVPVDTAADIWEKLLDRMQNPAVLQALSAAKE
jgi:hypothetical protein